LKLLADLHCHTTASGHAYSTLLEMINGAKEANLQAIAITDHGPALPGGPHLYHFGNMKVFKKEINGIKVLKGVEANILDYDGSIDVPGRYLKNLDIVLAGFHNICYPGGSVDQNTNALIKAMENPYLDIIVHPGNPDFPIDVKKFVKAAKDLNVLIEINNSSFSVSRKGSAKNCLDIAEEVARVNGMVSFGSDSHIFYDVGNFSECIKVANETGLKDKQIINTDLNKIELFLSRKNDIDKRARILPI